MRDRLRVIIADDERPARSLLTAMLRQWDDVEIVGEAADGTAAVELIERVKPDLALLDLQMPELDGLGVIRLLKKRAMPMVAFVTAHDDAAVEAFELNAIDYVLKPVDAARLRETISRAVDALDREDVRSAALRNLRTVAAELERSDPIRRIPVRRRNDIVLVPISEVVSIIADGELLHLTTTRGEHHTISHRLKDLEARLDGDEFIRLSRGTIVNLAAISRATPMPGGTLVITLNNGQEVNASRFHSRLLRERLLRL